MSAPLPPGGCGFPSSCCVCLDKGTRVPWVRYPPGHPRSGRKHLERARMRRVNQDENRATIRMKGLFRRGGSRA